MKIEIKTRKFHHSESLSLEFSVKFKGKDIVGILEIVKHLVPERYDLIQFKDVEGFDWYYFTEEDKDYIADLRSTDQKELEALIIKKVML